MPKTWSMCPWVYTTVPSRSVFQPRIRSWLLAAITWLPVSTSSSPSSVAKAQMLPNDALKAVRSATSASPRSWVTGGGRPRRWSPRRSTVAPRSPGGRPWPLQAGTIPAMAFTGFGKGAIPFYDDLDGEQQPRLVAREQGPLRGRGAAPDGAAARRTSRPSSARRSCSARTGHPLLEGQVPLQDQHRGGHLPAKRRLRVRVARRRRAPRRRRRVPPGTPAARPAPRGDRRRPHRAGARAHRRRPRKAKADVTAHDILKTAPRG